MNFYKKLDILNLIILRLFLIRKVSHLKCGPGCRLMKKINPVSDFITSAKTLDKCPLHDLKEVAVIGRSNVGKSSLLNQILKRDIVKVSQTPGKTQLINFFTKEGKYCVVDLPGYGFTKISGDIVAEWKEMIEGYLLGREQLVGVMFLLDVRREFQEEEKLLLKWLKQIELPYLFAYTKSDKLSNSELKKAKDVFSKKARGIPVFFVSNLNGNGISDLEDFVYKQWIR